MSDLVDACVIGGGPAGSAVAQRLARLGHSVCVVERARFPRPHVGESLPPSILPVLEALGVRERVERAGFLRPSRAFVRWARGAEVLHESRDPGFQVDRARFDALLLEAAREAGARVAQPATASTPVASREGWRVPVEGESGAWSIDARFLIDATGRRSGLTRPPTRLGAQTVALYAYWRGASLGGSETRVEAAGDAWYWGAPLPDGSVNATAFLDARACASLGARRREEIYRELIARSMLLRGCLEGSIVGGVRACDASFVVDEGSVGETFVRAGEAAFAIDPLSSQGVQAAITSGLAAAAVAHTILERPERASLAIAFYSRRQREIVERHRRLAAAQYAERAATSDTPFWRARAQGARSPVPAPIASPAPRDGTRVRLSPDASLARAPMLAGDAIVDGAALEHPSLDRPVAYLGDVALAPLLGALDGPEETIGIVRRWCRTVPAATCWGVIDWLWGRRILVPG